MPLYSDIYHNNYHTGALVESDRQMDNSGWWVVGKQKEEKEGQRKEGKQGEREKEKGGRRKDECTGS